MSEQIVSADPSASPEPAVSVPSLAEYREQKANPKPADDATPDPEVEGDPDLAKEIDALEAPKDNETPAEKAARTRKHKEAARKGYLTRLKTKAERLEAELKTFRERQAAFATPPDRRDQPTVAAPAPQPAARPVTGDDPSDPEPTFDSWAAKKTLEAFMAEHPNLSDPYAAWQAEYVKEWNRWDRRREQREAEVTRQAAAQRERDTKNLERLAAIGESGRSKYRDYDETIAALGAAIEGTPANRALADYLAEAEQGEDLAYALAKDLPALLTAVRNGERAFYLHLGAVSARVSAKPAAAAPPPVTSAPAPHTPVGAGASAGGSYDPAKSDSLEDYRRAKAAGLLARG